MSWASRYLRSPTSDPTYKWRGVSFIRWTTRCSKWQNDEMWQSSEAGQLCTMFHSWLQESFPTCGTREVEERFLGRWAVTTISALSVCSGWTIRNTRLTSPYRGKDMRPRSVTWKRLQCLASTLMQMPQKRVVWFFTWNPNKPREQ